MKRVVLVVEALKLPEVLLEKIVGMFKATELTKLQVTDLQDFAVEVVSKMLGSVRTRESTKTF